VWKENWVQKHDMVVTPASMVDLELGKRPGRLPCKLKGTARTHTKTHAGKQNGGKGTLIAYKQSCSLLISSRKR
jgi:hypothetical protein